MKPRIMLLLLLGAVCCSAGTFTVTDSGTWAANAPTSTESAPNVSWGLSFQVDSNPIPINFTAGVQTVVPITNLVFNLNGSAVQTQASGASVELFTGQGFRLYFSNGDALQIQDNAQLFSGTESSPTVLAGTYPPGFANNAFLFVNSTSNFYNFTSNSIVISASSTSTPEPSSFLLLAAGLAALVGIATKR